MDLQATIGLPAPGQKPRYVRTSCSGMFVSRSGQLAAVNGPLTFGNLPIPECAVHDVLYSHDSLTFVFRANQHLEVLRDGPIPPHTIYKVPHGVGVGHV